MGELRKDYFRERYVIINPERAKRPHDLVRPAQVASKPTPFASGNEKELLTITYEYPLGQEWRFRVVPNKFAIVKPEGQQELETNTLFTWANNYGYHEIVIEGREDNVTFASLGPDMIAEAIRIGITRVTSLQTIAGINAVAYFKNEGLDAGASINHPHSQIIATAIVPPNVRSITELFRQKRSELGFSPLYAILDHERNGTRMLWESKHFALLCPYASRFPMEVLIIPLRDHASYTSMTEEERTDLAQHLHTILSKLASMGAPYNIEWMHSTDSAFHWHLSITPRLSVWAGYEIETNIIVNPIPPEHAAAFYRS